MAPRHAAPAPGTRTAAHHPPGARPRTPRTATPSPERVIPKVPVGWDSPDNRTRSPGDGTGEGRGASKGAALLRLADPPDRHPLVAGGRMARLARHGPRRPHRRRVRGLA